MPDKPPWFPFYASDWVTDEAVRSMAWDVRGVYHWLLCWQWHDGDIPLDLREISRRCSIDVRHLRRIWPVLAPHFPEIYRGSSGQRRANPRLENIRKEYENKTLRQSEAGKRGADKRWGSHRHPIDDDDRDPNSSQSHTSTTLPRCAHTTGTNGHHTDETIEPAEEPTAEQPPAASDPPKPKRKTTYDPANPYHAEIQRLCRWFYTQPDRYQPTDAQKRAVALEVYRAVNLDMGDTPRDQRVPRLRAVLEAAIADEFWSQQLLSLAGLRKSKGAGSPPKWRTAEARLLPARHWEAGVYA